MGASRVDKLSKVKAPCASRHANRLCCLQGASPEMLKLKDEGNKLFGRKEYQKALEAYEKALKQATPEAKEEIALLHSNKAACYMMNQR